MLTCTCNKAESVAADEPLCTQPDQTDLVLIEEDPLIGETPQGVLQSWLTPNPLFYVRNHYSIPSVDETADWSLSVDGQVENSLNLDLNGFRQYAKQTLPVTLECAGNNRSDLTPGVPGNPFQNGAVSTAIWGGIPLSVLLNEAGIKDGATEILFEGLDRGQPAPDEEFGPYTRSLPIEVAMHPDTLLAYEMNGEAMPIEHGYPLRLVVPGWYGMASVKWLTHISVTTGKYEGFWQKDRYIVENDEGVEIPVSNIEVKSLISWPQPGTALKGMVHVITGLAWSGNADIASVEISDDGGETWKSAELVGPKYKYAWQQWNFVWTPSSAGHVTLVARAHDENGNKQPLENRWNRLGYVVNGVRPVCVDIKS